MVHGYVGLGEMGGAMCRRLLDVGTPLRVVDLDPAAVSRLTAAGAAVAADPAALGRECEVVSVCVPADDHVRAVVTGPGGIVEGARQARRGDLTVLVHSTVHPDTMREIHAAAAGAGVAVHDACVAGGSDAATAGTLVMFVSELATMAAPARAAVESFGTLLLDTGPPGSGAAVKIGVNVMTYAQHAALTAAFELVAAQGASTDALVAAWRHNGQFGNVVERFSVLPGLPASALEGMRSYLDGVRAIEQKDLALALSLGRGTRRGPSPVVAALHDYIPVMLGLVPPD